MHDSERLYIIVTPCKDEEEKLPDTIKSVVNQSVKPALWLIVNDSSTDNTQQVLDEFQDKAAFPVEILILDENKDRDLGIWYSEVCRKGFDYALDYCDKKSIDYEYIALLDADISLARDYFERIIDEFRKNPKYGILSGGIYLETKDGLKWERSKIDLPRGGARVWRKECFNNTRGFSSSFAPDTVSNFKAIIRGWQIDQIKDVVAVQLRPSSSAEGLWKGYKIRGQTVYFLWYPVYYVIMKFFRFIISSKPYLAIAFLLGYCEAQYKNLPRTKDREIIDYNSRYINPSNLLTWFKGIFR